MEVYLKYVGHSFLPGVPARDLTYDEARKLGISRLLESGLYRKVSASKPSPSVNKALPGGSENKGE